MITFEAFKTQWENVVPQQNGYIKLDIDHPLDLRMGYYYDLTKSLAILGSVELEDVPSTGIVKVSVLELAAGKTALEFRLLDDIYEEVYLKLCWDLIDASSNSRDPWKVVINRYLQWYRMLEATAGKKKLSFSKQKGLLGELLYLEELINNMPHNDAIQAWKGPEGCDQDFQYDNTWAEIKTVALAATSVKVSSLEQLRQSVDGLLCVYVLEKSQAGKDLICLPQCVENIASILESEEAQFRFKIKLMLAGYKKSEEEEYQKNMFRLIEKREYKVCDSFPKLTKENVPAEIESANYRLSFVGIEPYRR